MLNWAPVCLSMYEQLIEKAVFSRKNCFLEKSSLKITFKHHLSEMCLLPKKAQHPFLPLCPTTAFMSLDFRSYCRKMTYKKNMITLSTDHNQNTISKAYILFPEILDPPLTFVKPNANVVNLLIYVGLSGR